MAGKKVHKFVLSNVINFCAIFLKELVKQGTTTEIINFKVNGKLFACAILSLYLQVHEKRSEKWMITLSNQPVI